MENIYGPIFFNNSTWPDTVKTNLCSEMHAFLAKLTEVHYKMLGLTVIYIPNEGIGLDAVTAALDKELVKRLDGVVVHWTKQISMCLGDQDQTLDMESNGPTDEIDFWVSRCKNIYM